MLIDPISPVDVRPTNILIGRQPIFTRSLEVNGYELLYRSQNSPDQANFLDGDQATLRVILNSFFDIGPDNLLNEKRAFVNLTRNFLVGRYPMLFSPQQTVIEIIEDVAIDRELIAAVTDLNRRGYLIALDDVIDIQRIPPILPIVQIVKLDIMKIRPHELAGIVRALKPYNIRLVAEKVETQAEYQTCMDLGFDFFQGYFFCKPNTIQRRQIETTRVMVLRALSYLNDANVDFGKLETIIARDVSLSYKLLRLVNSGYYGLRTNVISLRQALAIIGLNQLRGWMTLLLMSRLQNKPHELSTVALTRARMAESFGRALGFAPVESFFLTGLFSVLDAYLDVPMSEAVKDLPIAPEISRALTTLEGKPGAVLAAIYQLEQGNFHLCLGLGLETNQINHIFADSVAYSTGLIRQLAV